MKTADFDNWRTKYFDTLDALECEQRRFQAIETSLKRIAGRLCTAALGQSTRLDAEIRNLQSALRSSDIAALDPLALALTDAIQALDQGDAPLAAATSRVAGTQPLGRSAGTSRSYALGIDDASVRATLAALLAELRKDKVLAARSESLDAQLADTLTRERLSAVLTDMTELTGQRIQRLESEKHEIATLLSHMVDKLDEIGRFVAEQKCSQMKSHASSETLNDQLAGEMRAMGESVDAASDLQQLRMQVRTRIESIDKHVQHFRERETALAEEMRKRSEHMRGRIAELETRAQRLQHQLEDEQRLSTIDMLTRIPNRLAYEKRIDEEINRWQRFGQPACLAVWDVDRFKKINDTYGHRAGDRVLGAIAECLSNRLRSTDFVARYGGEEFVMILPGTTCDDAGRVVDELRVAVAQIGFHFRGTPVAVTISAGLTQLLPADSAGAAFDRADKALYLAKQSGRDRCVRG